MKFGLREKILLPVVLFIAAGMGSAWFYSYISSTKTVKDEIASVLNREVKLTVKLMDNWLDQRKIDFFTWGLQTVFSEALVETGYYGKSAAKGASTVLSGLETGYAYFDTLFLADRSGRLVSGSHGETIGFNIADREYFKTSLKGETAVSNVIVSRDSGKKVFVVSAPVKQNSRVVGVLAGAVKFSAFTALFVDNFKLGLHGYAFIADEKGSVMALSRKNVKSVDIGSSPLGKAMQNRKNGLIKHLDDGIATLSAFKTMEVKPWRFVITQSLDEAFAPLSRIGFYNILISIVLLLLVICAVGFVFHHVIYLRLNHMVALMDRVNEGNWDVKIQGGDQDDEIGVLANAFNLMIVRLKKSLGDLSREVAMRRQTEKELEDHRAGLEKIVKQRTGELEKEIDQRRQGERELKYLKAYLTSMIDSMPSVLVGVDEQLKVTQWNLQAEQRTAVPSNQAVSQDFVCFFPYLADEADRIRAAVENHQVAKITRKLTGEIGEKQYQDIVVYPLREMDGAVIRMDDVTERVRIEEMMIQSEKMLSVGGLAAGMAHEINNPLAGILQNIQVIQNRLKSDLPKNREAAETIGISLEQITEYMELRSIFSLVESTMGAGRRAAQIVDNMLSFSRKEDLAASECRVEQLLDKTVELAENDYDLKKRFDFRAIEIVRVYDGRDSRIRCNPGMLQQVFFNILKNGSEAMAEQTHRAAPPRFTLGVSSTGETVVVSIRDNGPGMDEPTRKRIFEPFFTTKEIGVGTGLGLSVSYFIVTENHKGTLAVESTPGQGTEFIITIPAGPINGD